MIATIAHIEFALSHRFEDKEHNWVKCVKQAIMEEMLANEDTRTMALDDRILPNKIALIAFKRLVHSSLDRKYGYYGCEIEGLTDELLLNYKEQLEIWNGDLFNYAIAMINTMREERKENETMNTNINENEVICERCGCVIDKDVAKEVDGKYYCQNCFDNKFVVCEECGEILDKYSWDAQYVSGYGWYCQDCFNNKFVTCANCGEIVEIDDAHWVEGDEEYYCDECFDEVFTYCEHCDRLMRCEDAYTVYMDEDQEESEQWCERCVEWSSWTCEECGERYSDDVDHDDDYICSKCESNVPPFKSMTDTWKARRGVQGYSWKPEPLMCFVPEEAEGAEDRVYYGFELEVDKAPRDICIDDYADLVNDNSMYTYVKHDGSLHNGMEIVSHPATLAYHMSKKDTWEMIFNELISAGFKSHDAGTCGLHVHISLHSLEAKNPVAVNNMLFLLDHFWDKFVKFSRRTESQLEQWARRYSEIHGDYQDWKRQAKGTRDRYYALNLQNKHTIEIRMFRGTLNLDTFMATLQFVDVLCNRCIEIGNDLPRLQSMTWEELVRNDYGELNCYLVKRGLAGTDEEIARAQEEERKRIEEARQKAREERRRQFEDALNRLNTDLNMPVDEFLSLSHRIQDEMNQDELMQMLSVGDRVRVIHAPDGNRSLVGLEGTVNAIRFGDSNIPVEVRFDVERGYDNNGMTVDLHTCADSWFNNDLERRYWNCEFFALQRISE